MIENKIIDNATTKSVVKLKLSWVERNQFNSSLSLD